MRRKTRKKERKGKEERKGVEEEKDVVVSKGDGETIEKTHRKNIREGNSKRKGLWLARQHN